MISTQQSGSGSSQSPRSPSTQPFLSVSITDPIKLGNNVQAYIFYHVITKTNLPDAEFIKMRRQALDIFVNKIASHHELQQSEDLRTLLQVDEETMEKARPLEEIMNILTFIAILKYMLGFLYFIIYYLTPHVLRKHVTSYLCSPSTPPITYHLNYVNMLVTVNRAYV
ncbi:unnamed protein product, partial [Vitis vinifera]